MLEKYYSGFGGRDTIIKQSNRVAHLRRRTRVSEKLPAQRPTCSKGEKKRFADEISSATPKHWSPPSGSWEDEMVTIDVCDVGSDGKLVIYLAWENGAKTKHDTHTIYSKCPQKVVNPFSVSSACLFPY
jgi:chromobox protein 1